MARPNRLNYATGPEGQKRFVEALRKWQDKQKALKAKAEAKKPAPKKPVAKKPVAKKPATKKPAAKKPVAKKPPVKKPVAKKPAVKRGTAPKKTANNLKIKKAANTAVKTTKQAIKKATPVVKKAASTLKKKAGEAKQAVDKKVSGVKKAFKKRSPAPKTPAQKAVSKVYRTAKKGVKTNVPKVLRAIKNNPKAAIKGGVAGIAAGALTGAVNERMDRMFAKRAGKSLKEYQAGKKKVRDSQRIIPTATRTVKGIAKRLRGKSGDSPITKKTITNKTSKTKTDLQIAKRRARKAKGYNKEKLQREVRYQEKFGKQGRTWSNPEGAKGGGKPSTVKTDKTTSKPKKMSAIEKRNRQRFGDAHVDRLKIKNKEFQSIKKIKDRKERKKKREAYRQKYGR